MRPRRHPNQPAARRPACARATRQPRVMPDALDSDTVLPLPSENELEMSTSPAARLALPFCGGSSSATSSTS
eukprot:6244412-Prymnesium_polylepis.1